ncbi:MAG: hypothetical protein QXO03_03000 [Thermoplasmatales archaeon]
MVYRGLLFASKEEIKGLGDKEPDFFGDLNIDQIVDEISAKYDAYNLRTLLLAPPSRIENVKYRQEIFADLEREETLGAVRSFSEQMKTIMAKLSNQAELYDIQREGRLLDAGWDYSSSLRMIYDFLKKNPVESAGLRGFFEYLENYLASEQFTNFENDLRETAESVASISYYLIIESDRVTVRKGDSPSGDFSGEIENLFSKFKSASHEPVKLTYRTNYGFGHVQAEVLKLLEKIYPSEIKKLRDFSAAHGKFVDQTVLNTFYDIQFYLAYTDYIDGPKKNGLPFCLPKFTNEKVVELDSFFDLALAAKLLKKKGEVITNDLHLESSERIVVITGPNSGGKTTFSRSIGQIYYLASLGLPVPAKTAVLGLPDRIFTHFEKSEKIENLRGKLEDDLVRIKAITDNCTDRSLLIVNEMLSSTTVNDALSIGKKILELVKSKGSLCIFVTFLGELSRYDGAVSIVGQINEDNPEIRTYKFVRAPWNGLAYAIALAHKHRVSYKDIIGRIGNDGDLQQRKA